MPNPKARKRKKTILLLLMLLVVAALAVAAVLKKKEVVITVQTEKAARRNLTELVVANGKIQPVMQVKISPEVSGEIIELPFKEGQNVKKGDVLVKIKPDNYVGHAAIRPRRITNIPSPTRTPPRRTWKRRTWNSSASEELFKNKLISESDCQTAKTDYDVAKATVAGRERTGGHGQGPTRQWPNDDLSKTTIYSPNQRDRHQVVFAGRRTRRRHGDDGGHGHHDRVGLE